MTVETDLQEIAEINADIFEKDIKDLSDSEKARIVKELTIYSLSDSYARLCKDVESDTIVEYNSLAKKELEYSQLQRDVITREFMQSIISLVDDSIGWKVFKANIAKNAKNFTSIIEERIEIWYDAPAFTSLDIAKHRKILTKSVKAWLSQTITAYEKTTEIAEEQGAY